ncbi:MAG: dihydroorotate dehydrogenase [Kiritimatiellaeota bacterium]|nr:dihydroorotate dehydrogenase [Kiritimatiellota bacterium]
MSAPDLSVNLGGVRMRNPVMVASGTFGYGPEYADLVDLNRLGAFVVKGISLDPWRGNPPPRTVETASGLINAIGLQNPGADVFLRDHLPFLRQFDVPVIVNIWGRTVEEYAAVAERLSAAAGLAALELNVSCPNIKEGRTTFGTNLPMFRRVLAAVRLKTRLPLIPKLAPDLAQIKAFAQAAEEEGADALSLINSIPALAIDIETRRPVLANRTGGLSGPAIKPIALKLVWEAAQAVKIPVVGIGGIATAADALEFIIAGASAVAVGTANFTEPTTALTVADGIRDYLVRHNLGTVKELVGTILC